MDVMIIKRVLIGGWKNFARGGAVSAATVLIMTVTLAIISFLIFISALLTFALNGIKEKVDVSIYFVTTASEQDIFAVKGQLEKLPQVVSVTYTSREDVLTQFRAVHAGDQLNLQALDEIGTNPFDARLEVRAKDPSQYESIVNYLEASPALSVGGTSIIDRTNYKQNQDSIHQITRMIQAVREIGFAIIILFVLASILIAFATVRLAIYTAKDEIAVMRLVGASNAYIQGPFIVTGIITGITSAMLVVLLLWPATWYTSANIVGWSNGFNVASYYGTHFAFIFLILVGSGIALGAVASVLAINKYLKV